MPLPLPATPTTNSGSTLGRDIRASGSSSQIVDAKQVSLGDALLVYDAANQATNNGGGLVGKQVVSATFAGGNLVRRFVLGNVLVQQGGSLYGTIGSSAGQPGVLLVYDGPNATGRVLARIPIPPDTRAFSFGPENYPGLRGIGGRADTENDVPPLGTGGTLIGSVGIGLANPAESPGFGPSDAPGGTNQPSVSQLGWTLLQNPGGQADTSRQFQITNTQFPIVLGQVTISAADALNGLAFARGMDSPFGNLGDGSGAPNISTDGSQYIKLQLPSGVYAPNTDFYDGNYVYGNKNIHVRLYLPGGVNTSTLSAGNYNLVDTGQGGVIITERTRFDSVEPTFPSQAAPIGGGSTGGFGGGIMGLRGSNPGGGAYSITGGPTSAWVSPFSHLLRRKYQAEVNLFAPNLQRISLLALFNAAPVTGRIDVSVVA